MSFIQLPYIINENDGAVQTVLILSNEVSYTVTLGVISAGGTADGECYIHRMLTNYTFILQ